MRAVTQQDKDNLLAQVQAEVEVEAFAALQAELEPGEWLPPESLQIFTIAQAFDRFNDDEGDEVRLTLRTLIQGTALNQEQTQDVCWRPCARTCPNAACWWRTAYNLSASPASRPSGAVTFTMTASRIM